MKRELTACAAMVRLAFQTRASQGSNWVTWLICALALLIPIVAYAGSKKLSMAIGAGAGIPLAVLVVLWWPLLVSSLANQRRHSACLVPASGRRAVALILCGATLITFILTSLLVLAGGAALPGALVIALVLFIMVACVSVPRFGWPLYALIVAMLFFNKWLRSMLPFAFADVLVTLGPVLILGLAYAGLRAFYLGLPQQAGVGVALQRRIEFFSLVFPAGGISTSSLYVRALRRDCAEGRIAALLMHSVGPLGRGPSTWFFMVAALIALAVQLAVPGWVAHYRGGLQAVIPVMMVVLQLALAPTIAQAVYKARREQALVRLAPRAPGAPTLNATLARSLLLEYGRCWLGSTLLALVSLHFLGVEHGVLLRILAVFLMTLTWANLLLRDYGSERGAGGSAVARILFMLGCCGLVLAAAAPYFRPGPWLAMGCGALAVGLVFAFRRWNKMLRAPTAFPAARAH